MNRPIHIGAFDFHVCFGFFFVRLMAALLDLNGWKYFLTLVERLSSTCPHWSFHINHDILIAFGKVLW